MDTRPLIIGHRGASALAPENTLVAFARALRDGADGVEFDVRLASDNVPVVIHDSLLSRTALIDLAVSGLSSDELSTVNVGRWFNRKFPRLARPEYDCEALPTLRRVFEFLSNTAAKIYLEMKSEGPGTELLPQKTVDLINEYSLAERTVVECFQLAAIAKVKQLDSTMRTAALFEPSLKRPLSLLKRMAFVEMARDCGADEIALHHTLIAQRLVAEADRLNMQCVIWTVDDPRWVRRAASLGLKALITNNPSAMVTTPLSVD